MAQTADASGASAAAAVRHHPPAPLLQRPNPHLPSLRRLNPLSHTISARDTATATTAYPSGATAFSLQSGERIVLRNSTLTCAPAVHSAAQHGAEERGLSAAEGRPHRRLMAVVAAGAARGAPRRGSRGGPWDGSGLAGEVLGSAGVQLLYSGKYNWRCGQT